MTKPLDGVRVIEMGTFVFVPAAAAVLADWGADVVKIEHPAIGDPGRNTAAWGVPAQVNGVSHLWEAANRGKRALALDVGQVDGRDVLLRLVDRADVFLTNFLPSAQRKLRVTPDDIMGRNPRIVYGRGSAQGPRGDHAERGGFDGISYWGRSGASLGVTPPDADWPLTMPGPGFGDLQTGTALAGGISAALFQREQTGRASLVDVSLMSAGLWAMGMTISGTSVLDVDRLPFQGHHNSPNPLTNQYRTKDGHYVALAFLQSDRYWPDFCIAVDRAEWLTDDRFIDAESRATNANACIAMLEELFVQRDLDEWREILSEQDGQWDVLLSAGQVRDDGQAKANGYVQRIFHDGDGKVDLVPAPAQFDEGAPQLGKAPRLGADTDDVLREVGLDAATIASLRERNIVR
jgi:crotonobetainyl-CoA:carnitine CoA-transferase CaiB-like acyl-CoA transferase